MRGHGLLEVALYANLLSSELDSRAFNGNDMLPEPLEKAKQAYESLLEQDEDDNEDEQEEELALGCALKSKCSCD